MTEKSEDEAPRKGEGPEAMPERADRHLLEILVCPLTKTTLEYDEKRQELISRAARLAFPIRSGVPLLTVDTARHLDDRDEKRQPSS